MWKHSVTRIMVLPGYAFTDLVQAQAGYRYLELDFQDDDYLLDISALGLVLGLALHFQARFGTGLASKSRHSAGFLFNESGSSAARSFRQGNPGK